MTPEEITAWFEASRAKASQAPTFSTSVHVAIARLLRDVDPAGDGRPVPPAADNTDAGSQQRSRRRPERSPAAAVNRRSGHGEA